MEHRVDNQHQGILVLRGNKIPELYKANGGGAAFHTSFSVRVVSLSKGVIITRFQSCLDYATAFTYVECGKVSQELPYRRYHIIATENAARATTT